MHSCEHSSVPACAFPHADRRSKFWVVGKAHIRRRQIMNRKMPRRSFLGHTGALATGIGAFGRAAANKRPSRKHYDAVVVGAGSGGFGAALVAARQGLDVLLIEKADRIGGTAVRSGVTMWEPGVGRYRVSIRNIPAAQVHRRRYRYLLLWQAHIMGRSRCVPRRRACYRPGPTLCRYAPAAPTGKRKRRRIVSKEILARRSLRARSL